MRKAGLGAALAVLLQGCTNTAFNGPQPIITPLGWPEGTGRVADLQARFKAAAKDAADLTHEATAEDRQRKIQAMLDTGVVLVRVNCDNFFRLMASKQRGSRIGRDMVAPILAVLGGVVALRDFSAGKTSDYVQVFSLGSAAYLEGLDIIDNHFLFGSENIIEVNDLTFKALTTHQAEILKRKDYTFELAVEQLIDHQLICTPASILDLTKQAIAAGEVVPRPDGDDVAAADERVLDSLGAELGLSRAATPEEAGALWATLRGGYDGEALTARRPTVQMDESRRLRVQQTLSRFSPETRESFRGTAEAMARGESSNFRLARDVSARDRVELIVK